MRLATQRLANLSSAKKSVCGHFDVPDMEIGSSSGNQHQETEITSPGLRTNLAMQDSLEPSIKEESYGGFGSQASSFISNSFYRRRQKGGGSFFHSEVLKILEASPQESVRDKLRAFATPGLMLLIFISMSATDPMVKSASKQRHTEDEPRDFLYDPSTVICVASIVSVVIGNGLSFLQHRWHGVRRIWNVSKLLRMSIPSAMFTVAQILKFISLKYMPVDVVVLLDQSSLVILAVTMRIFMKKVYTPSQWCLLVIISFAMLQYMVLKDEGKTGEVNPDISYLAGGWLIGLGVMITQVVIQVIAAVLCEKMLKGQDSEDEPAPFWEQKAQLEVSGSIVAFLWCYFFGPLIFQTRNKVQEDGFFSGWDEMTVLVLCVTLAKLWLSGLIAKLLDSVVKQLGSCAAMLVTYFLQLSLPSPWGNRGKEGGFTMNTMVSMLIVGLSVSSFAISSEDARRIGREMKKIEGIMELTKTVSDRRESQAPEDNRRDSV